jgi:hypothetical protein
MEDDPSTAAASKTPSITMQWKGIKRRPETVDEGHGAEVNRGAGAWTVRTPAVPGQRVALASGHRATELSGATRPDRAHNTPTANRFAASRQPTKRAGGIAL